MSPCRELADALGDYVADELPPERRAALERHLGACPPCVILLESYRITIRLARRLPPPPLPAGLVDRLRDAIGGRGGPAPG